MRKEPAKELQKDSTKLQVVKPGTKISYIINRVHYKIRKSVIHVQNLSSISRWWQGMKPSLTRFWNQGKVNRTSCLPMKPGVLRTQRLPELGLYKEESTPVKRRTKKKKNYLKKKKQPQARIQPCENVLESNTAQQANCLDKFCSPFNYKRMRKDFVP